MIPLPVILAELIMAMGGALFGANALALWKNRRSQTGDTMEDRPQGPQPEPPPRQMARGKIFINMLIGLVIFTWGLATFLVRIRN